MRLDRMRLEHETIILFRRRTRRICVCMLRVWIGLMVYMVWCGCPADLAIVTALVRVVLAI